MTVLILWAAVVAERLGYSQDAALTLGSSLAGLTFPKETRGTRTSGKKNSLATAGAEVGSTIGSGEYTVTLLGRRVRASDTPWGVRATFNGEPIDPACVRSYLQERLGPALPEVRSAMEDLARSYKPTELATRAYALYERFRPESEVDDLRAEGLLDLDVLRSLAA